jgi:hypothetical protein
VRATANTAITHKEDKTMETNIAGSAEKINQAAKGKLNDLAHFAGERIERGRAGTAETLESAAAAVRTRGGEAGTAVSDLSGKAATAVRTKGGEAGAAITDLSGKAATNLDTSARYVRNATFGQVWSDMGALARRHPGAIAVGAIVAGYCMGRMMTRHSRSCTQDQDA